jgi:eukaryotic-like serine/threonine-protein kinase
MMTPDYASPEQVRGDAVTTASDVYSLGVLLYELLTGRRPYSVRSQSLPDIVRAVCDTEPPLPSTAASTASTGGTTVTPTAVPPAALRGDLDTIIMKALRKEPSRRYVSAQDLSLDIDRYLRGLPVLARADTLGYRSREFVARHKASVTAAGLVLASLVAAVVLTRRQARIAEQRFQDTRNLANVLLYEAYDAMREVPGTEAARAVLVKRGLEYHDRLAAQPERDPLLRLQHSTAYIKLGDLFQDLGDTGLALDAFDKALVLREQLAAEAPSDFKALQQVGTAHNRIGAVLRYRGNLDRAVEHHREAARIAEVAARALGDAPSRRRIVVAGNELANDLLPAGQAAEALAAAQMATAAARQIMEEQPSLDTRFDYSAPLEPEADALDLLGRYEEALAIDVEMRDIAAESMAARPQNKRYQVDFVTAEVKVAGQLRALGRTDEARSHVENGLRRAEALMAQAAEDAEVPQALAYARAAYGELLAPTAPAEALAQYAAAAGLLRGLLAKDRANLVYQAQLAALLLDHADVQQAAGRLAEARASLDEGAALAAELKRKAPAFRDHQVLYARARARQGRSANGSGPAACRSLGEAAEMWTGIESRGVLSPEEAAESRSARALAAACVPS